MPNCKKRAVRSRKPVKRSLAELRLTLPVPPTIRQRQSRDARSAHCAEEDRGRSRFDRPVHAKREDHAGRRLIRSAPSPRLRLARSAPGPAGSRTGSVADRRAMRRRSDDFPSGNRFRQRVGAGGESPAGEGRARWGRGHSERRVPNRRARQVAEKARAPSPQRVADAGSGTSPSTSV